MLRQGGMIALSPNLAPSGGAKRWIGAGAIASTLLWIIGSFGFSLHVARFGSYDKTYGSLGAAVILLMWFYLTGAELNAEIALRTASSDGRAQTRQRLRHLS